MVWRPKYLCFDDFEEARQYSLIAILRDAGEIAIEHKTPAELENPVTYINKLKFDGVLMDLVLESSATRHASRVSHSTAQALRDEASLGRAKDIPIVLWSSRTKLRQHLNSTAKDLYDLLLDKAEVPTRRCEIGKQLFALASGYRSIAKHKRNGRRGLIKMLGLTDKEAGVLLDRRIGVDFENVAGQVTPIPPHAFALFIIRELLLEPFPLVDEPLLGARLGVDITKRKHAWTRLLQRLKPCSYSGIFSDGWQRWWWAQVERWWGTSLSADLQPAAAKDRVNALNRKFGLNLIPAKPMRKGYRSDFWAVCEAERKPVATVDALLASNTSTQPWHDPRYISKHAALQRMGIETGLTVHPSDEPRFALLRKSRNAKEAQ